MSLMADKNPAAAQTPQQMTAGWQYNMYNMNMYQNPYMYNPAYQAQNYQFYGQAMQANAWNGYRGYTPGGHLGAWGMHQPGQQQINQENQAEPQPVPPPQQIQQANDTSNSQQSDGGSELPPLPPGPPPSNPAPPGTQDLQHHNKPYLLPTPSAAPGPIRFNVSAVRPKQQLPQANAFGVVRPLSKKQQKKQKKLQLLQQMQLGQHQALQDEEDEDESPPLPASPPPPPPPPPPSVVPPPPPTADSRPSSISQPPLPSQPQQQQPQGPVMVQNPPGFKGSGSDWPASLRDYVNRCYSKCITQVDSDRVGVILKGKIMRATNDGVLWTKNWAEEPLPLLDSDAKPAGQLNLGLNLKDRLKMSSRLGPPNKVESLQTRSNKDSHKRSSYRPSFKRSYSSESSSSSSSDSDDNSSSSKRRDSKRSSSSWSSSKRHSSKKSSEKHLYKEYGAIGGGAGTPVKKEILDKRAARFSSTSNSNNTNNRNKNGLNSVLYVLDSRPNPAYVPKTAWSSVETPAPKVVQADGAAVTSQDWEEDLHIVGTSTDIEKPYLRLTSAPDASQVRPPEVLAKALAMVKEKWEQDGDYHYTCEQLKSIRQDLTVQGIRDEFTIKVYETHARIALEKGDHAEFNQCQSQLTQLHSSTSKNRGEFIAYRILYYIFTNEFLDLCSLIHKLTPEDKKDECTSHALQMATHWVSGVHSRFFQLYPKAPKMASFLIDLFINRERTKALKIIIKAYRPAVPVDLVMKELAFGSVGDTLEFLDKFGLVFIDNTRTKIDCKSSTPILASV